MGKASGVCVTAERACVPPALCIVTMRRGAQSHHIGQQRVTLDEDAYLILQGPAASAACWQPEPGARAFVLAFSTAMLENAAASPTRASVGFLPHLRPHGDAVGQRLRQIAQEVETGAAPECWHAHALGALLNTAVRREAELRQRAEHIDSVKPATRQTLFSRVWRASDFILSHYDRPLTLAQIASEARLSLFHFARLFGRVHGVTPHAYLLAKRLAVARRLLARTDCALDEVAVLAGFNTRSSLFRHVRKQLGCGGGALRIAAQRRADERPSA